MEAIRGRFCFYRYECKVAWYKLDCCEVCILRINRKRVAFSILICRAVGRGEEYGGAKNRHLEFLNLSPQGLISSLFNNRGAHTYQFWKINNLNTYLIVLCTFKTYMHSVYMIFKNSFTPIVTITFKFFLIFSFTIYFSHMKGFTFKNLTFIKLLRANSFIWIMT